MYSILLVAGICSMIHSTNPPATPSPYAGITQTIYQIHNENNLIIESNNTYIVSEPAPEPMPTQEIEQPAINETDKDL